MVTKPRTGLTLFEVAVSLVVLGAVLTTVAQVIQWSAAQHRAIQRKRCALEAATTVLDRLTVREWSAINRENAAAVKLPAETARLLVDSHVDVTVAEETKNKDLPAKRISVDVTYASGVGGKNDHVRLSTWVFERRAPLEGAHK
jgi:Tfp pilus assembly protein PilV